MINLTPKEKKIYSAFLEDKHKVSWNSWEIRNILYEGKCTTAHWSVNVNHAMRQLVMKTAFYGDAAVIKCSLERGRGNRAHWALKKDLRRIKKGEAHWDGSKPLPKGIFEKVGIK